MAKVFSAPKSIPVPSLSIDFKNPKWREEMEANDTKYRNALKAFVLERKKGKNVGEIIRIPHADSYAEYMVASMRPLELVHVPLSDAWESPHADLMTAERIQQMLDADKKMKEFFANRNK